MLRQHEALIAILHMTAESNWSLQSYRNLNSLAEKRLVELFLIREHKRIEGNEIADIYILAWVRVSQPLNGTELTVGILYTQIKE